VERVFPERNSSPGQGFSAPQFLYVICIAKHAYALGGQADIAHGVTESQFVIPIEAECSLEAS
jgi:hypothetical protein